MLAETRAILIGVDGYAFRPLASAVNDAVALRDALTGADGLVPMLAAEHVTLLVSPAEGVAAPEGSAPATRDAILAALEPHYRAMDPVDRLIVFFAGHGMVASPDGRVRETLLLPADTRGPEEGRNMLSLDYLRRLFAERGPRQTLWIVDACRDMPYLKRPHGYEIDWSEEAPQGPRRQAALFSVAQGGQALSEAGGQGRFTGHLLEGLRGAGAAKVYVKGRNWCVTPLSLHEYASRRVAAVLEGFDAWTLTVQMPQFETAGSQPLDPLRDLPHPPPARFTVRVAPPEAGPAVEVRLEIQPGLAVPGWPSEAPPDIYELRAQLKPGVEVWGEPAPALRVVDLREEREAVLTVPSRAAVLPSVAVTTGERGIAPARLAARIAPEPPPEVRKDGYLLQGLPPGLDGVFGADTAPGAMAARLTVRAADPGARICLSSVGGFAAARQVASGETVQLLPGAWDVVVCLGAETIGATRVLLAAGEVQEVAAVAQITPATAALLTDALAGGPAPERIMPSETIGPMQGAILPTLLPLLAVKPFDAAQSVLFSFDHLEVPTLGPAPEGTVALAVALDGVRADRATLSATGLGTVWLDSAGRVAILAGPAPPPRELLRIDIGDRAVEIAGPVLAGGLTALAVTAWPDGRLDGSISVFRQPLGASWDPTEPAEPPGAIARALALGARAYQAGANLEETPHDVVMKVAYAKWIDPILGAIAFHAHDQRLTAEGAMLPQNVAADLRSMLERIRQNMATHFGALPDSRIIAAMLPHPTDRQAALAALLDDTTLGQPALTASLAALARAAMSAKRNNHWATERLDRIAPGQVFNLAWA